MPGDRPAGAGLATKRRRAVGPRCFRPSIQSGALLVVANQDTDTVVTFRIDP